MDTVICSQGEALGQASGVTEERLGGPHTVEGLPVLIEVLPQALQLSLASTLRFVAYLQLPPEGHGGGEVAAGQRRQGRHLYGLAAAVGLAGGLSVGLGGLGLTRVQGGDGALAKSGRRALDGAPDPPGGGIGAGHG